VAPLDWAGGAPWFRRVLFMASLLEVATTRGLGEARLPLSTLSEFPEPLLMAPMPPVAPRRSVKPKPTHPWHLRVLPERQTTEKTAMG
jgi:hypothetical protein